MVGGGKRYGFVVCIVHVRDRTDGTTRPPAEIRRVRPLTIAGPHAPRWASLARAV
jgi:hypothetical protein